MNLMEIINRKNYLATIALSEGSKIFRHLYVKLNGKEKDILENGNLSCAIFVSAIIHRFNSTERNLKLINEIHATVLSTVKDLKSCGWYEIKSLRPGAVISWKKSPQAGHPHIGFYISDDHAISNSSEHREARSHNIKFDSRELDKIYWHDFLN